MVSGTNISPEEISKFERDAHLWWDPEGPYRTLHQVNPLRLRFIEEVAGPLEGKRVVDVGCGGGILSEALARRGAREVLGIDLASSLLEVAELHALDQGVENVRYRKVAVEVLAEEQPEAFHIATCMEMLEHVPRPQKVVEACAHLVKPDGFVFFSTLNRTLRAYLGAILAAEYLLGLIPKGTHQFERFIKPSELVAWARPVGLRPVVIRGIGYNPLTRRLFLTDDISINYMVAFKKGV